MPARQHLISTATLTVLLSLASSQALSEDSDNTPLSFVVVGDMPYSTAEEDALNGPIFAAIQTSKTPLLIHVGDIKSGGDSCSKTFFEMRHRQLLNLLPGRTVYTPGDNEWTDCDRLTLTHPVSELEMLDEVRQQIVRDMPDYPADWHLRTQPGYPENSLWQLHNTQFVTLHQTGTSNGRVQILKSDEADTLNQVAARDSANLSWLTLAFENARNSAADALIVSHHADITQVKYKDVACSSGNPRECDPYLAYRQRLSELAADFKDASGQLKPVLVIHGDTHEYCMAKDMDGENIWRLNAWGDFKVPADATRVEVKAEDKEAPFSVKTLVHGFTPEGC
ncbi:MAG: hypothetical protein CMI00_04860 [Oceanospirillaceae bacterium]|nr:hypothetical protein [Oceanospirillaceae bacterium]|tara:strand:- start:3732 stop:4745 length:1014 start_codon:yes stop_codon:yes gene_type:complete